MGRRKKTPPATAGTYAISAAMFAGILASGIWLWVKYAEFAACCGIPVVAIGGIGAAFSLLMVMGLSRRTNQRASGPGIDAQGASPRSERIEGPPVHITHFGAFMAQLRTDRNCSVADIAMYANCSETTIRRGEKNPNPQWQREILKWYLYCLEDDRKLTRQEYEAICEASGYEDLWF